MNILNIINDLASKFDNKPEAKNNGIEKYRKKEPKKESIKNAVDAVKLNLRTTNTFLKIRLVEMAFTPSVNAAEIRKNDLGQK